jgi:hypothetical protein
MSSSSSIRLRARDGAKKNDDAAAVGAQAAKWLSESPLLGGACLFSLRDHPSWKLRYAANMLVLCGALVLLPATALSGFLTFTATSDEHAAQLLGLALALELEWKAFVYVMLFTVSYTSGLMMNK